MKIKKVQFNQCCSNCGSANFGLYTKCMPRIFSGEYEIYLCGDCRVGSTLPRPTVSTEHYVEAERPEIINPAVLADIGKEVALLCERYKRITGREPRNMLDVGCGNGLMLSVAKQAGLEVMGIEPSEAMCRNVRAKGIPVTAGTLEDFHDYHAYDLIVFNSVIEHLPQPAQVMKILRQRTGAESVLVFQQAVFDGLVPRVFKTSWYGWSPSEHFWHYTQASFTSFCREQGLAVLDCKRSNLYYHFLPLRSFKQWKSFLYSNVVKLVSLLATASGRGDSLTIFVARNQESETLSHVERMGQ